MALCPGHGLQSPWEQGQPFTGAPDGDKILVYGSIRRSSGLTPEVSDDSEEVGWEGSSMLSQKFPHNLECVQDPEVRLMQGDGGIPASGDPVAMGSLSAHSTITGLAQMRLWIPNLAHKTNPALVPSWGPGEQIAGLPADCSWVP